jgi:hypothetical protein
MGPAIDGHGQDGRTVTYPPLDTLKPLAEDVWIVDSGPLHGSLPLRMTVIRLPGGQVLLHSPTPYSAGLAAEIARIGRVGALVAPNSAHWLFVAGWQSAMPGAQVWAAPGLRRRRPVRRGDLRIDRDLSDDPPAEWGGAITLIVVPGGFGFREVAFFHAPSRTLVLTDLVLNLEPERLPPLARAFARAAGMTAPHGRAPVYLRAAIRLAGASAAAAAAALVALRPGRVVVAHGRIIEHDATAALERSLGWLLAKTAVAAAPKA